MPDQSHREVGVLVEKGRGWMNGLFCGEFSFTVLVICANTRTRSRIGNISYRRTARCEIIAGHYQQFINTADSEVDISGQSPDDTSSTYLRDMIFSKRVFIYYDNPDFSLAQRGSVETLYKRKGLSVQFRDARYAWSHREDGRAFRPKPLGPNSILLPDTRNNEGLRITAKSSVRSVEQIATG